MRVPDPSSREWYLREASAQQWSVRQLERNIESCYYQRILSSGEKNDVAIACSEENQTTIRQFIKDPYVLEFVGLPPYLQYKERTLEDALIDNMQQFLLELGKGPT